MVLSDGAVIPTHCVIWGGGIKAGHLADVSGLKQGRGGRIDVEPDLRVADQLGIYVVGDIANIFALGHVTLSTTRLRRPFRSASPATASGLVSSEAARHIRAVFHRVSPCR